MKNRYPQYLCLLLATLLTIAGCARQKSPGGPGGGAAASKPVTVKGSDTMVILTQRLAEAYMAAKTGTVVQVNGGGSGTGIAAFINGTADVAQASRPMKPEEREQAEKSRGATVVETPVALDALAVFVHSSSPVKELSIPQIAGMFTGNVKNWKEVGGKDAPVILYGRENSSGTYDYFREHVLAKADFSPSVQTLQGTAAVINAVSKDVNGVGYGGIAYAKDVRPVAIKPAATATAVAPSTETVADGSYPLARKLFFYTLSTSPERVRSFVEWSLLPEAQKLVEQVGYFPLNTTASP